MTTTDDDSAAKQSGNEPIWWEMQITGHTIANNGSVQYCIKWANTTGMDYPLQYTDGHDIEQETLDYYNRENGIQTRVKGKKLVRKRKKKL